jgi:hypothetical protein
LQNSIEQKLLGEIKIAKEYFSNDETTLDFLGINKISENPQIALSLSSFLGEENEVLLAEEYGLNQADFNDLQLDLQQAVSLRKGASDASDDDLLKISAYRYLSYLIGCAFGRWDIDFTGQCSVRNIYEKLPNQPPAFKNNAFNGYVELYGIADLESDKSLTRTIETLVAEKSDEIDKAFALCRMKDWNHFLSKVTAFFDYHLNQYSQNRRPSPIYWPLQTPSGSYTLWVYYHRLTDQTLYTCVNDFVEPKLKIVSDDLKTLRNKYARSGVEETELAKLTDLEAEMKDFRDELLQLGKFWKPNLNDGIQIVSAPLWKLFQHKQWQKKLKETWGKLEAGEYDWAHLAYSIWPARVLKKCHQDRSLAIAHDVENDLWHEVEVTKPRKKEPVLEWQPKPLSDTELNTYIKNKIQTEGLG